MSLSTTQYPTCERDSSFLAVEKLDNKKLENDISLSECTEKRKQTPTPLILANRRPAAFAKSPLRRSFSDKPNIPKSKLSYKGDIDTGRRITWHPDVKSIEKVPKLLTKDDLFTPEVKKEHDRRSYTPVTRSANLRFDEFYSSPLSIDPSGNNETNVRMKSLEPRISVSIGTSEITTVPYNIALSDPSINFSRRRHISRFKASSATLSSTPTKVE